MLPQLNANASTELLNELQNDTVPLNECTFQNLSTFHDLLYLISDNNCYRYSLGFTVFLCVVNVLILLFGLVGNSVVIYVVIWRLKAKTASNIFILNLAAADLLVILCCIPTTVVANIFTPWVFSETTCKIMAFTQGLSVFCSAYSLVAISFDRCRAIHPSMSLSHLIPRCQAYKVVVGIWIIGIFVTLPWARVFRILMLDPGTSLHSSVKLPFCQEKWESSTQEAVYFLVVHVLICYLIPLVLITIFNIYIWKAVRDTESEVLLNSGQSYSSLSSSSVRERQYKRNIRVMKFFTMLNFAFFLFWLPLYVIMARVKVFSGEAETEAQVVSVLVPIAQLLGTCNSCVNPVLYAFLSHKFRESFQSLFKCRWWSYFGKESGTGVVLRPRPKTSIVRVVGTSRLVEDTRV